MVFEMFKTKSPEEKLRENKRLLDRSIRELERERMTVENQVKKTMAEMKKMAKAGQDVLAPSHRIWCLIILFARMLSR
jgi:charged multivesicular body protein 2A